MISHIHDKEHKFHEPILVGGVIVILAYAAMYLLAASPVVIRALGPLFAS